MHAVLRVKLTNCWQSVSLLSPSPQADDILIVLISGGGSRLLSAPCPPITIQEQNQVTRLLSRHGGTVADLNAMRRHTSLLKGGRLGQLAAPARVIGLIMSDTPGDALELVGSGPTAPDPTTPRHCLDLVKGGLIWIPLICASFG